MILEVCWVEVDRTDFNGDFIRHSGDQQLSLDAPFSCAFSKTAYCILQNEKK